MSKNTIRNYLIMGLWSFLLPKKCGFFCFFFFFLPSFSLPFLQKDDSIRSGWEKESLEAENLFLMPGQSKTYNFTFTIPQLAALDCHSVELHLGKEGKEEGFWVSPISHL